MINHLPKLSLIEKCKYRCSSFNFFNTQNQKKSIFFLLFNIRELKVDLEICSLEGKVSTPAFLLNIKNLKTYINKLIH